MNIKYISYYIITCVFFHTSCSENHNLTITENNIVKEVSREDTLRNLLEKEVYKWFEMSYEDSTNLFSKFILEEDLVEGGGWYHHKKNKNKNHSHIEVPVSTNGYFYLKTNYSGDDWIFHNYLICKVADTKFSSSSLETYSDFSVRSNTASKVFESLHLTLPKLDGQIIKFISENTNNEVIIRFKGKQKHFDITLSNIEKEILRDSFVLSQYLTAKTNNSVGMMLLDDENFNNFYIIPTGNNPTADIRLTN